jgi:hypothetical protein
MIKHPLFPFRKPRLILSRESENGKLEGELALLGFRKKLRLVKQKGQELLFHFDVDIITFEVELRFTSEEAFGGILDTPIGHIRFTGRKVC